MKLGYETVFGWIMKCGTAYKSYAFEKKSWKSVLHTVEKLRKYTRHSGEMDKPSGRMV